MELLKQQLHYSTSAAEKFFNGCHRFASFQRDTEIKENKTKQSQKQMISGLQAAQFFTVILIKKKKLFPSAQHKARSIWSSAQWG